MAQERKRRRSPEQNQRSRDTQQENNESKPATTYIPPAPINRKQIILVVASMIAVAVAIFLCLSIFFKVDKQKFTVEGNRIYRADRVWEVSGLQNGDSLLTFGKAKVASRIMQELPYVKSVRIQITLPDTVTIFIEEHVVYLVAKDTEGAMWFLSTDGKVLEKASQSEAQKRTVLEGFLIKPPKVGEKAVADEPLADDQTGDAGVVIHTNAERLKAALDLTAVLEKNGILGSIASINVADMEDIDFWYEDRFQVKLGDSGLMSEKVALVESAISTQLGDRETGILHVSSKNGIMIEFEHKKFE